MVSMAKANYICICVADDHEWLCLNYGMYDGVYSNDCVGVPPITNYLLEKGSQKVTTHCFGVGM